MRKRFTLAAAMLMTSALFASAALKAQNSNEIANYIEVDGYAEQEIAPDTFYLRVDIREEDSKGKKSLEQQQKAMVSALKALGVNTDKELARLGLSSSFHDRKSNMAEAAYQIKLNDAELLAKVWQKLDDEGLSRISFTKAEYSKLEEKKNELRQQALINAKSQAEAMAKAIGQKIGKCFRINSGYVSNPVIYGQARLMSKSFETDSFNMVETEESGGIMFNNIKLSANITARFILE